MARQTTGLSTRVIARRLSEQGLPISHATVHNYEAGNTLPSMEVVRALARIYSRSVDWFFAAGPTLRGIRYRCLKSVTVGAKKQYEGEALAWLTVYRHVEGLLERQRKARRITIQSTDSGRAVAEKIRRKLGFEDYPIPSISRLLEEFGIHVIQVATTERIDGFAAWLDDSPAVVLNSNLPNDRIHLNAAHELAHHLFSDCRGSADLSPDDIEKRAFECASHLLIPESALERAFELKSMVRLIQYKERYGISLAAMIYRARESRILDRKLYEWLWRQFSRLGWRKHEPGKVAPDRPVRMEALIDAAVNTKKVTYADIACLAGVDERAVRQRVLQAVGGMVQDEEEESDGSSYSFEAYRNGHLSDDGE